MNTLPFYGVGHLTADPELRSTPTGKPVATFQIAHNPRRYQQATGAWVDGTATFLRGTVWGPQAQNVTESLRQGMAVVVIGRLVTRHWTSPEGTERSSLEIVADHLAPSLARATATVTKNPRSTTGGADEPAVEEPPV